MPHRNLHRKKQHSKKHYSKTSLNKNILNKTIGKSVSMVKTTSSKYMPKLKYGLENVGSKVVQSGEQSIPYLQKMTRKMFSSMSSKTKRRKY